MDEIGDTQRGETGITAPAKGSFAWSMALLIKQFRDLGIDMVIEEIPYWGSARITTVVN